MKQGLEAAHARFVVARSTLVAELQSAVESCETALDRERMVAALDAWNAADGLSQHFLQNVLAALPSTTPEPMPHVFTPAKLAERWGCSLRHVRNLMETGQLKSFEIGSKMFRVTGKAVEEYEAKAKIQTSKT